MARERRRPPARLLASGGRTRASIERPAKQPAPTGHAANSSKWLPVSGLGKMAAPDRDPTHAEKTIRRSGARPVPMDGGRPIAEVRSAELLAVLRRVEIAWGAGKTAHRALEQLRPSFPVCGSYRPGMERDPSIDLRGALPPYRNQHFAALTDPKKIGDLLRSRSGLPRYPTVQCALMLAPLGIRPPRRAPPGAVGRHHLEAAEWRYTVSQDWTLLTSCRWRPRPWRSSGNLNRSPGEALTFPAPGPTAADERQRSTRRDAPARHRKEERAYGFGQLPEPSWTKC